MTIKRLTVTVNVGEFEWHNDESLANIQLYLAGCIEGHPYLTNLRLKSEWDYDKYRYMIVGDRPENENEYGRRVKAIEKSKAAAAKYKKTAEQKEYDQYVKLKAKFEP